MNTQLSLFEQEFTTPIHTTVQSSSKVVMFPGLKTPPHKPNYRKGEEQTVFPIKRQEDLDAMASWLYNNADHKYLLGFILGINLGLRANELLELKHSDIFFPNGEIRYVSDDFSDTTDKMAKSQIKTCADNIRMMEKMQEVFELFSQVPDNLTDDELGEAFFRYDGEPYCELVCCGIEIIRKYLKKRSEYDEWQKKNLPFSV